jgi:hypothetical protein
VTASDVYQLEEKLGRKMAAPREARQGENVEVRLQSDDDLSYVLTYTAGEDQHDDGTDCGHHDHAEDLEGLRNLKTAGGISERVYDKIVDANPRAAYAL